MIIKRWGRESLKGNKAIVVNYKRLNPNIKPTIDSITTVHDRKFLL